MENHLFDLTLFNCIKRDDRLALNTLFSRYYEKLCTFSNGYVRNTDDAEEIVSDVFFNLWKSRHSIEITSSLRAYLYIAVKHGSFAKIKKRQDNVVPIDDLLMDSALELSPCPHAALTFLEMENHLGNIIASLPLRCREIFTMKWTDGLTYKEISEILGITEKTVENQVVKAFEIIRKSVRQFQALP